MWEAVRQSPALLIPLALAGLLAVYFIARVVFLAYFHAKRDHLRRLYRAFDQEQDHRSREP
jgi:hypothetical protein